MALSVTGLDTTTGRVIPKGSNIIVPPQSAGIGDLIYGNRSSFKVIARGTGSAGAGTLYGAIYGFVAGMAMVVAPSETSCSWGTRVEGMPEWGAGTVLMRNGLKTSYYAQMNTATNQSYITGGSNTSYQLGSAYQATTYNSSNWSGNAEIKARYGSWTEFIRQTLRVNGAPGTPFGATADGVKVHEFGRWMTSKFIGSQSSGTALYYCYHYGADGEWWLPSMFELGELMIDEHLNLVNENYSAGVPNFAYISPGAYRWSSVLYSSGYAWFYTDAGMSNNLGFPYFFTVRPVTLLKLV